MTTAKRSLSRPVSFFQADSIYEECTRAAKERRHIPGGPCPAGGAVITGVYGYPKDSAAAIAVEAVRKTLGEIPEIDRVIFVCCDEENFRLYAELLG